MTEPVIARKEQFEITFPTDDNKDWATLAHIVFRKRYSLAAAMGNVFGIKFQGTSELPPEPEPITSVVFYGNAESAEKVMKVLNAMMDDLKEQKYFKKEHVRELALEIEDKGYISADFRKAAKAPTRSTAVPANENRRGFTPKTQAQAELAELIDKNEITFAVGSAGTGKTYVAVIKAVQGLKFGQYKKLLIARPAMEAGEKIGFLPGDERQKLAPYMRPIYDELDKAFGFGKYKKMLDDGTLEIVPVAYMRGRTFENAFIILDEAQNTTIEQIKMALTRIGEGSKMVVTGDPQQIDLPNKSDSGLVYAANRLNGIAGVGIQHFKGGDVVRSKIVQAIVGALTDETPPTQPTLRGRSAPRSR